MSLDPTFPTYVSVYMENKSKNLRQYTHALLHYLTGEKVSASNSSQCRQLGENDQVRSLFSCNSNILHQLASLDVHLFVAKWSVNEWRVCQIYCLHC